MEEEEEEVTEEAAAARGRVARACSLQAASAIAGLQHRSSSRGDRSIGFWKLDARLLSSVLRWRRRRHLRRRRSRKTTTPEE